MEFIVRVRRLKALCHLIKEKLGMHKYSNKIQWHNNTLLHILSHTNQSETDTH